jgi:hypothetical protein
VKNLEVYMRVGTIVMILSLLSMIGLPLYYAIKYAG